MNPVMKRGFLLVFTLALSLAAGLSRAQDYPKRSIHIVVPTVPGGGTDFTARYLAQKLGQELGQAVVVDNHAGANGNIGVEMVAKAKPDGYTLVMPITSFPTNPSLFSKLPFDTVKDFDAIGLIAKAPLLLVVNRNIPAKTVGELIELAKKKPGTLNFAHSGSGTTASLAGEMFKKMAEVNIVSIGYKGGGQIMTDLLAGHVQIYFSTIPAAIQQVNAGSLNVLAVTSPTRVPELPNVPTMIEAGLPKFEVMGWFGLFAPAGTPKPVIAKLNKVVVKVLAQPETRKAFAQEGLIVGGGSAQDMHQFLLSDIARWKKIIADAGIQVQ